MKELLRGNVVGPTLSSSPVSSNTGGDAQVREDDLKKSGTEVWQDKTPSSPSLSSHSKQASTLFSV